MSVGTWWAVIGWALGGASAGALFCWMAVRAERNADKKDPPP